MVYIKQSATQIHCNCYTQTDIPYNQWPASPPPLCSPRLGQLIPCPLSHDHWSSYFPYHLFPQTPDQPVKIENKIVSI